MQISTRKWLVGLCLLLALLVVLLVMLLQVPSIRRVVLNSKMTTGAIRLYNSARPWLHVGNSTSCLQRLAAGTKMQFTSVPDKTTTTGCVLRNVVSVSQSYIVYNRPCLMTCSMALAMYNFEKDVIQPLAQEYFAQPVARINHIGTYNCRSMRGSLRLLSEHAYANAIDITSFELANGTLISVQQHWDNAGKKSKFLHGMAQQACQHFRKVLTPNFNALHDDHFHFDQGVWKRCGY